MSQIESTRPRKPALREPEQQGTLSYILQGSVFIGVLLLLFVLAGFRG